MRPKVKEIYMKLFPDSMIKEGKYSTFVTVPSGQCYSITEKFKRNRYLINPKFQKNPPYPDFTESPNREVKEDFENQTTHLCFCGWADREETKIEKWVLLDTTVYNTLVRDAGGVKKLGKLHRSAFHTNQFYSISLKDIQSAIILDEKKFAEKYSDSTQVTERACEA